MTVESKSVLKPDVQKLLLGKSLENILRKCFLTIMESKSVLKPDVQKLLLGKVSGKYLTQMCILNKDTSCQSLTTNPLKIDSVACFPESL